MDRARKRALRVYPESMTTPREHRLAVLAFMAVALIWGSGFPATKVVLQAGLAPGALLTLRFTVGALGLGALLVANRVPLRWPDVRDGLVLGALVAVIFWTQTDGLRFTTASKSGFITGLYVVFTPMASLLLGDRLKPAHALAATVAVAGLFLLVRDPSQPMGGWNRGDTETLVCAVLCGFHIALTGHYSRRSNGWVLAFVQVATVAVCSALISPFLPSEMGFGGAWRVLGTPAIWLSLAYMGLFATTLAFWVQSTLQKHLGATESAIIFSLEPLFSAVLATSGLVPGVREHLGLVQIAGGVLILAATLMAELGPRLLGRSPRVEEEAIG